MFVEAVYTSLKQPEVGQVSSKAGETACPAMKHQRLAAMVGQAFSLSGLPQCYAWWGRRFRLPTCAGPRPALRGLCQIGRNGFSSMYLIVRSSWLETQVMIVRLILPERMPGSSPGLNLPFLPSILLAISSGPGRVPTVEAADVRGSASPPRHGR